MKHENSVLGLCGPLDLGLRVFTRCRSVPKRVIFTLAELTSGTAKRRDFPVRFPSVGFPSGMAFPVSFVLQAHEKIRESVAFGVGR